MSSVFSKMKIILQHNPIVTGLTAAVAGYMLMNQSPEALATMLPSLLFLLPFLLMIVMCTKHMTRGRCDKPKELAVTEKTSLGKSE